MSGNTAALPSRQGPANFTHLFHAYAKFMADIPSWFMNDFDNWNKTLQAIGIPPESSLGFAQISKLQDSFTTAM